MAENPIVQLERVITRHLKVNQQEMSEEELLTFCRARRAGEGKALTLEEFRTALKAVFLKYPELRPRMTDDYKEPDFGNGFPFEIYASIIKHVQEANHRVYSAEVYQRARTLFTKFDRAMLCRCLDRLGQEHPDLHKKVCMKGEIYKKDAVRVFVARVLSQSPGEIFAYETLLRRFLASGIQITSDHFYNTLDGIAETDEEVRVRCRRIPGTMPPPTTPLNDFIKQRLEKAKKPLTSLELFQNCLRMGYDMSEATFLSRLRSVVEDFGLDHKWAKYSRLLGLSGKIREVFRAFLMEYPQEWHTQRDLYEVYKEGGGTGSFSSVRAALDQLLEEPDFVSTFGKAEDKSLKCVRYQPATQPNKNTNGTSTEGVFVGATPTQPQGPTNNELERTGVLYLIRSTFPHLRYIKLQDISEKDRVYTAKLKGGGALAMSPDMVSASLPLFDDSISVQRFTKDFPSFEETLKDTVETLLHKVDTVQRHLRSFLPKHLSTHTGGSQLPLPNVIDPELD